MLARTKADHVLLIATINDMRTDLSDDGPVHENVENETGNRA